MAVRRDDLRLSVARCGWSGSRSAYSERLTSFLPGLMHHIRAAARAFCTMRSSSHSLAAGAVLRRVAASNEILGWRRKKMSVRAA